MINMFKTYLYFVVFSLMSPAVLAETAVPPDGQKSEVVVREAPVLGETVEKQLPQDD